MSDPWDDPEFKEWARDVQDNLVPKMRASAMSLTLFPSNGVPDVKIAVELGMAILLGKPLMIVVESGQHVPDGLVRAADEIVETRGPIDSPGNAKRITAAIHRIVSTLPDDEE